MAQSGFTPILLYHSTTAAAVPTSGNLVAGVLALNINDMKLYSENSSGVVTLLAANVTAVANGGTGQTTANAGLNALLPVQTSQANKYLQTDGSNTSWDGINLSTADITGVLPVVNGGTGTTTPALVQGTNITITGTWPNQTVNASGSGSVTSVAATVPSVFSISGSPVTTSGTLAMTYSGTALPVVNGGTGQTSYTDGQLLIGNTTGNTLTKTTLTAGFGITITNASGAITVAATGSGITWVTKTTAYTAVNGDYMFCDTSSAAFTITLPASPTINNTIYFQDAKGTFNVNALSIDPGANNIMGSSGNLVSTLLNAGFGLFFNGTEWRIF